MLTFLAQSGSSYMLIADESRGPSIEDVKAWSLDGSKSFFFSPDGNHVAVAGMVGGEWRPIVDELVGPAVLDFDRVFFRGNEAVFVVIGLDGAMKTISLDLAASTAS